MTTISEIAPYPASEDDATAANLYRHMLVDAQVALLDTMRFTEPGGPTDRAEQMRCINAMISAWTMAYLMREIHNAAVTGRPADPDEVALDLWNACDAGDSFGELLYDMLVQEGIDPEAVHEAWKSGRAS